MKFVLVLALVGVAAAGRLENTYLPPAGAAHSGGSGLQAPYAGAGGGRGGGSGGFVGAASHQAPVAILKYSNEPNGAGGYSFNYETENGIQAQESAELRNAGSEAESIAVHGSYSYTAPDGTPITVNYVADENGFRAEGNHLPTPPPIPEAILRSLEQNAAEEAAAARAPSAYAPASNQGAARPGNAYIPPVKQQPARRPASFNQQSGYNY